MNHTDDPAVSVDDPMWVEPIDQPDDDIGFVAGVLFSVVVVIALGAAAWVVLR